MLLDRRQFFESLPALMPAAAAAEEKRKTRFYLLEQFYMENGSQPARLHEFFSKALAPALAKVHGGVQIYLEALVAPHMPQAAVILGLESFEQIYSLSKALFSNEAFVRAHEQWEAGEPPLQSSQSILLEATDYSPEIVMPAKPPATPRVFELRVYQAPTARQWKLLHERFKGPEIPIFHRSSVHPVFYSSSVIGPNRPNLTYLIPFDSLAAREKAWAAFGADPEWVKVRRESVEKGGQISRQSQISLWRATPYSPFR